MNPNLKKLAEETAPRRIKVPGFTYIDDLFMWVADKPQKSEGGWIDCKKILEKDGAFMLTPPEFWKYYFYCEKNRPDIIEDIKSNVCICEWLDCIADYDRDTGETFLRFRPEIEGDKYKGGQIIPWRLGLLVESFLPEDLDPESGLPVKFADKQRTGYGFCSAREFPDATSIWYSCGDIHIDLQQSYFIHTGRRFRHCYKDPEKIK
jgi:hypothetical protein